MLWAYHWAYHPCRFAVHSTCLMLCVYGCFSQNLLEFPLCEGSSCAVWCTDIANYYTLSVNPGFRSYDESFLSHVTSRALNSASSVFMDLRLCSLLFLPTCCISACLFIFGSLNYFGLGAPRSYSTKSGLSFVSQAENPLLLRGGLHPFIFSP